VKLLKFNKAKKKKKVIKPKRSSRHVKSWRRSVRNEYRNVRATDLMLDRRMQQRRIIPDVVDDTARTCLNCGHHYTGRVCPQCGQVGTWERYTWRQAIMNFLDIWGLGNRPMFRTLRELFTRPGYMVRDYLNGHRQFYFPPFKLMALVIVFLLAISWLTGASLDTLFGWMNNHVALENLHPTGTMLTLTQLMTRFIKFLAGHQLYEWLVIAVVAVLCIWVGFRHVRNYNIVETYIFLVFVLCQLLICRIPALLGEGLENLFRNHVMPTGNDFFMLIISPLTYAFQAFETVLSRVRFVYALLVPTLLLVDFKQFYGLTWKNTVFHLLVSVMVFFSIAFFALVMLAILSFEANHGVLVVITSLVLAPIVFYYVDKYLVKNAAHLNSVVTWACKLTVLMVTLILIVGDYNFTSVATIFIMMIYAGCIYLVSIMPLYLYKRYHRTSVALALWLVGTVLLMLPSFYF